MFDLNRIPQLNNFIIEAQQDIKAGRAKDSVIKIRSSFSIVMHLLALTHLDKYKEKHYRDVNYKNTKFCFKTMCDNCLISEDDRNMLDDIANATNSGSHPEDFRKRVNFDSKREVRKYETDVEYYIEFIKRELDKVPERLIIECNKATISKQERELRTKKKSTLITSEQKPTTLITSEPKPTTSEQKNLSERVDDAIEQLRQAGLLSESTTSEPVPEVVTQESEPEVVTPEPIPQATYQSNYQQSYSETFYDSIYSAVKESLEELHTNKNVNKSATQQYSAQQYQQSQPYSQQPYQQPVQQYQQYQQSAQQYQPYRQYTQQFKQPVLTSFNGRFMYTIRGNTTIQLCNNLQPIVNICHYKFTYMYNEVLVVVRSFTKVKNAQYNTGNVQMDFGNIEQYNIYDAELDFYCTSAQVLYDIQKPLTKIYDLLFPVGYNNFKHGIIVL